MITFSKAAQGLEEPAELQGTRVGTGSILLVGLDRLAPPFVAGFESDGIRTYAAENIEEGLELTERLRPGLIVVGQECVWDPFTFLSQARNAHNHALILYLAPSNAPGPALKAVSHGADDVIPPPHSVATILLRAQLVRHRNGNDPQWNVRGEAHSRRRTPVIILRVSRAVLDGGEHVRLTGREFELLERLLSAGGRVVSREALLADIWGEEQDSEAVLDATVHRLRRKLEHEPAKPSILTTVRGVGYRLDTSRLRIRNA